MSDELLKIVAVVAGGVVVVGLLTGIWTFWKATIEWRIAKPLGNGRAMYARSTLRSQALRLLKLSALGALAALVVLDVRPRRIPVVALYFLIILATTSDAFLDLLTYRKLKSHFEHKVTQGDQP